MRKNLLPPHKMSNFLNSEKAPTPPNQNLAKVDSHVGHFRLIYWEPGQKPPQRETKADKSRCICIDPLLNRKVFWQK